MLTCEKQAGLMLAERLGLKIIGTEADKVMVACPFCDSHDAGRVFPEGNYWCHSCQKALNAFDLCKVTLGDHKAAIEAMVAVGRFEPTNGNGNGNGKPLAPVSGENILETIARLKGVTPDGFLTYGATVQGQAISFPMYDGDGEQCSTFTLDASGGKGLYAKAKPVGIFLPGHKPQPGETWHIVEGVKDAAALYGLGWLAAGLPNSTLNLKFAELFRGVDVVVVPDGDTAGQNGATKTAANLAGIAKSVKVAHLPVEVVASKGQDVRDVLRDQGEEAVRKAIDEAEAVGVGVGHGIDYGLRTCADLVTAQFDIRFHIEGIMAAGQPLVIAGPQKALKTSIALDMAFSLATAGHFLGRFKVPEAVSVGFMSGESGLPTLAETVRRIARAAGHDPAGVRNLIISDRVPQIGSLDHLAAIDAVIQEHALEVFIIDPVFMAMDGADAGNLFIQGQLLRRVSELCQERGCTFV